MFLTSVELSNSYYGKICYVQVLRHLNNFYPQTLATLNVHFVTELHN